MLIVAIIAVLLTIGRYYYRLANKFDRNAIAIGFLGAGVGIVSVAVSFIVAYSLLFFFDKDLGETSFFIIVVGAFFLCGGIIVLVYKLLERHFKKNSLRSENPNLLDK